MKIKIYSTSWCGPCNSAKNLLNELSLPFQTIDIEEKEISRDDLFKLTGGRTVPQIVIDEKPIGGFDNLVQYYNEGNLKV